MSDILHVEVTVDQPAEIKDAKSDLAEAGATEVT